MRSRSGSPRVKCEPLQLSVTTPVGPQSYTRTAGAPDLGHQQDSPRAGRDLVNYAKKDSLGVPRRGCFSLPVVFAHLALSELWGRSPSGP